MLKKTVTYNDFNGVERTEDFYFNLTEAELVEMETDVDGGYAEMLQTVVKAKDVRTLIKTFKDLVLKAYGVKSPDGRRFEKSEEISRAFAQTPAYSQIFMELAFNDIAASEFVNGIMPEGGFKNLPKSAQ